VIHNVTAPAEASVTMLGIQGKLKTRGGGQDLVIEMPRLNPDRMPCRYAFTFKITGAESGPEK